MCYNYVSQVCTHRTPTPMIHSTNIGNNSEPDNNKGSKNFSCNEDFFIPCGVGSQGKNPDFVGRAAAKSGAQVLRGETYISGNGLCTRVFYGKFLQTAAGQRCSFQNALSLARPDGRRNTSGAFEHANSGENNMRPPEPRSKLRQIGRMERTEGLFVF